MKTTYDNGMTQYADNRYNGYSVQDLYDNETFASFFDLREDNTVEVKQAGSNSWSVVGRDYVIQLGDEVKFSRDTGVKGTTTL